MAGLSTTVKIFGCFVLWCTILAASTQGRSVQRIHDGHRGTTSQNRSISDDFETSTRHSRLRHSRHHGETVEEVEGGSAEETESLRPLANRESSFNKGLSSLVRKSHAIRKRHNGEEDNVSYKVMSDDDKLAYEKSKARSMHHQGATEAWDYKSFNDQVEVRQAQNSALCNYTVEVIPDESADQSRIPKRLVNVICKHRGSRCKKPGTYCCIQTYSKIDVSYRNGTMETLKIFTGCVCSQRPYGHLNPDIEKVPIDD